MKIKPIDGLEAKLAASEDAESLGDRHFALDLYDNEPALTLELEFTPKGDQVWISARDDDVVRVYDPRTLRLLRELPAEKPSGIFFTARAHRIGY